MKRKTISFDERPKAETTLGPCIHCESTLGPFIHNEGVDGVQQIVCSTCGVRGPYNTVIHDAVEQWESLR